MLGEIESIQTNEPEYEEAWVKGEREAIVCAFQTDNPWGWGVGQAMESFDESPTGVS